MWDVLTDFPTYGGWSNFTSVDGVATVGSKVAMMMRGFSFSATVMTARPNEELEWAAGLVSPSILAASTLS